MQDLLTLKKCPEDWFPAWTPSIGHSEYWNGRIVSIHAVGTHTKYSANYPLSNEQVNLP